MDLTIVAFNQDVWNSLGSPTQNLITELVKAFSMEHFTAHQQASIVVWQQFADAGVEVTRLSEEDVDRRERRACGTTGDLGK